MSDLIFPIGATAAKFVVEEKDSDGDVRFEIDTPVGALEVWLTPEETGILILFLQKQLE